MSMGSKASSEGPRSRMKYDVESEAKTLAISAHCPGLIIGRYSISPVEA